MKISEIIWAYIFNVWRKILLKSDHAWIITSSGWMHDGVSLCSLETVCLSLASGWGSGGKTDVNLKAANYDKHTWILLVNKGEKAKKDTDN